VRSPRPAHAPLPATHDRLPPLRDWSASSLAGSRLWLRRAGAGNATVAATVVDPQVVGQGR